MRVARLVLSFLLILSSSPRLNSQQSTAPPQRDLQALALLANMTAATGWTQVNIPIDAVANGSVILETPPQTKTVVFKGRPGRQIRTEFPSQGIVFVINGTQGKGREATGSQDIAGSTILGTKTFVFPFFTELVQYNAPDVSVLYLGTETVAGQLAHRIELKRPAQWGRPTDVLLEKASRVVVSLSSTSFLPLKIDHFRFSERDAGVSLQLSSYLSDFRRVGPLLVPFQLEEFAGQQRLFTLRSASVQLNVSLSDAEFLIQ